MTTLLVLHSMRRSPKKEQLLSTVGRLMDELHKAIAGESWAEAKVISEEMRSKFIDLLYLK